MPRTTKIFVGNIAIGTTSEDLRELFSQYGEVTECDVLGAGNYAFVHMASEGEAESAISELSNYILNGSALNVERSTSETQGRKRKELAGSSRRGGALGHSGIPKRNTTKIFIGNIKDGTTNEELRAIFEPHGGVAEADVCSGFGFVHMQSQAEAIKAIKQLNGSYLNGNRLNIELSTEATQGRSSQNTSSPGFSGDFVPRGSRPLGRGRGHLLGAGKRYDPYAKVLSGTPPHRYPYATADPYASTSYGFNYDSYSAVDYATDLYANASSAPRGLGAAALSPSSDSFARDLLNLYIKNPVAFDKYAKDPRVQQSLSLPATQEADDPYYRPPKEYYEAKKTVTTSLRPTTFEEAYAGIAADNYAPIQKQPLLPIGSGRGLAGASLMPRGLGLLAPSSLIGHKPMGHPGVRARLVQPRPANLYTSFE